MKKVTNKRLLEIALIRSIANEAAVEEARTTDDYSKTQLCRGILWGKDKESGNLYHAYCEFCGKCFVDGTNYKSDCESYARKHGWVIGNTKETKDIAICPQCKEALKKRELEIATLENLLKELRVLGTYEKIKFNKKCLEIETVASGLMLLS